MVVRNNFTRNNNGNTVPTKLHMKCCFVWCCEHQYSSKFYLYQVLRCCSELISDGKLKKQHTGLTFSLSVLICMAFGMNRMVRSLVIAVTSLNRIVSCVKQVQEIWNSSKVGHISTRGGDTRGGNCPRGGGGGGGTRLLNWIGGCHWGGQNLTLSYCARGTKNTPCHNIPY